MWVAEFGIHLLSLADFRPLSLRIWVESDSLLEFRLAFVLFLPVSEISDIFWSD